MNTYRESRLGELFGNLIMEKTYKSDFACGNMKSGAVLFLFVFSAFLRPCNL
jgi:hypothetical protein